MSFENDTLFQDHAHTGLDSQRIDVDNLIGYPISASQGGTGLASPGTSGNVLTSNGTAWTSSAPSEPTALFKSFTAGESITAGNLVCLKPTYSDITATHDSYGDQSAPTTVRGSDTTFYTGKNAGGQDYIGFVKFDLTSITNAESILKAELRLRVNSTNGTPPTQTLERVSSADWDESTLTYNNMPTATDDVAGAYGMEKAKTGASAGVTLTWDITQLVRHWKAGNVNNYGLKVSGASGSNEYVIYDSSEAASSANRPILRVYTTTSTDGKVYKADCDDYMFCRQIIGIAQSSVSADATVSVRHTGNDTGVSVSGTSGRCFVSSTAGGLTTTTNGLNRLIRAGTIIGSNSILVQPQYEGILVEKLYVSLSTGTKRLYVPSDACRAIVQITAGTHDSYHIFHIFRDTNGATTQTIQDASVASAVHQKTQVVWSGNYIEITPDYAAAYVDNIYLYT